MEWLDFLKANRFFHKRETQSNVTYTNEIHKDLIETFIHDFLSFWTAEFILYLGEHILSFPSEKDYLTDTVELCDEKTEISIEIKKNNIIPSDIVNKYNVHVYSKGTYLLSNLQEPSFSVLEKFIFKKATQLTYIVIYDDPAYLNIVTNNFISIGSIAVLYTPFNEEEQQLKLINDRIKERNENIRWHQEISYLPPDVFYFSENSVNEISNFLKIKAISMCIAFLSLRTDYLEEDKQYESTFIGLKQIKFKLVIPSNISPEQIKKVFSLYTWAYSEKTTDKISLIQNIINLHIKEEKNTDLKLFLKNSAEIYEMVQENYRVYIQKSVKAYLDERKQIEDFIRTTSNEISKQISGITDIVTKNLFGLLATAITAAIGFNKPENQAYIPWVLYIYGFFSIALTIYYSSLASTNKKAILEVYEKRILDYKQIFLEDRIEKITGNSIKLQKKIFKKYFHWTVWPSIGISISAIIFGLKLHGIVHAIHIQILQLFEQINSIF